MGVYTNYWKIGKEHVINRNNMGYIYSYIGNFPIVDIRNKAKELYETYKNEWEGILLRVIRTDAWDRPKTSYYLYYNGHKFIKDPNFIYFDNSDIIEYLK